MPTSAAATLLPTPRPGPEAATRWVIEHLGDLAADRAAPSSRYRGGQRAAAAALASFDAAGYARRRNEVWPPQRRGASGLSPYIRHGLLSLPRVWRHVAAAPPADRDKFRDELLWQEYARHLYARLGARLRRPLRAVPQSRFDRSEGWSRDMACVRLNLEELERDGWVVNQARMWLASQWSVRGGADWRAGEEAFFRRLLDGSRAANLLGWQWTVGAATGRAYAFSRWQVEKRAPGLCDGCALSRHCPVEKRPDPPPLEPVAPPRRLHADPDIAATTGPRRVQRRGEPELVWITAESLGNDDPALAAGAGLPAVFVFDRALLARWRLSAVRLIFLVECLAELAVERPLQIHVGEPREVLAGRRLAATFTPVPGWRRRAAALDVVATYPWPWLCWPRAGSLQSYSAWRKSIPRADPR